jgi:hypothetical protein
MNLYKPIIKMVKSRKMEGVGHMIQVGWGMHTELLSENPKEADLLGNIAFGRWRIWKWFLEKQYDHVEWLHLHYLV